MSDVEREMDQEDAEAQAEASTVSDAMQAARPEAVDGGEEVGQAPDVPHGTVVSEAARKAQIRKNMAGNYRAKVERRDAVRKEGVKTLETSVNPNRAEASE